ncbi:MAG: hypothetical protein H6930_08295 [Rhodoferax sp.]|jgi:hypothetical protein|nr:hypothetical protein [Rhodoferax sp.]
MRMFFGLVVPLVIQIFAFIAVFIASRGGGSFMGLLALPVAPLSLLALLGLGINGIRAGKPLASVAAGTFSVALLPPIALLVIRALES